MNDRMHQPVPSKKSLALVTGALILMFGLVLALAIQPAAASPLGQDGYPVETATVTATDPGGQVTATVTATLAAATLTPTVTATGGTLPPPAVTGTPTMLVPVTGADLDQPGGLQSLGLWVALWLLGLLLVVYGLRAREEKR